MVWGVGVFWGGGGGGVFNGPTGEFFSANSN